MAKSYTSRAPGLVSVRLDLDADLHADLRILAATSGEPMSRYVRGVVTDHIGAARDAGLLPKKKTRKGG